MIKKKKINKKCRIKIKVLINFMILKSFTRPTVENSTFVAEDDIATWKGIRDITRKTLIGEFF